MGYEVPLIVTMGSLLLAVAFTVLAERRGAAKWKAGVMLVASYGVCVGVVSLLLVHFAGFGGWVSVAVAVPLGLPALGVAVRMAQA